MLRNLLRTSALSASAVFVRGISLIAINKIISIAADPSVYVLVGNFQNLYSLSSTISTGATTVGITKYSAEYSDSDEDQTGIWRAAFTIALAISAILGLTLLFAASQISMWILHSEDYAFSIRLFGICLFPTALHLVLLAILNGKKAIGSLVASNIAASLIALVLSWILIPYQGVAGAINALILHQALALPVSFVLTIRQPWFSIRRLFGLGRARNIRRLAKFTTMAAVTAIVVPVAQYMTRQYMADAFSPDVAGLWEAINRFSNIYLLVAVSPLTVYYLPRIAEIRNKAELRREVRLGYSIILPAALVIAVLTFVFREWIVLALFDAKYLGITDLMGWQAVGDVLKIGSWLLGFIFLAKGMQGKYVATEIAFSLSGVLFVITFTKAFGPIGAQMGYALNYAAYWVAVVLLTWSTLFESSSSVEQPENER